MREPLIIGGAKVFSITAFAPPLGWCPLNIYINTYDGLTWIQLVSDSGIKLNEKEFLDWLEKEVDNQIEISKKN